MKKVLAITCVLVALTMLMASMAVAQQPNWRLFLKADNGSGTMAMSAATLGVWSNSTDGYGVDGTASDVNDGGVSVPSTKNTRGVFPVFNSKAMLKDVKSPRMPSDAAYAAGMGAPNGHTYGDAWYEPKQKIWDLRVFCLPTDSYDTSDVIRLNFQVVNSTYLPPASANGKELQYILRMVDNKGFEGAPANGTVWDIPVPTGGAANSTWHTITLPQLVVSAANVDAAMAEGYQMQFIQKEVVPEPSSMMALGTGLIGLGGFFSRRRRA